MRHQHLKRNKFFNMDDKATDDGINIGEEIIRNEDAITRNEIKKAYVMRNAKRYTQIKIFNNF